MLLIFMRLRKTEKPHFLKYGLKYKKEKCKETSKDQEKAMNLLATALI